MSVKKLIIKNIIKRPVKTTLLSSMALLMAFAILAGANLSKSLIRGLNSMEARLGADIIVIPEGAQSEEELKNIYFKGTPENFYMDKSIVSDLASIEGVEDYSIQYFLASSVSDCCSAPVQIVGFDPENDFVVAPWIKDNYKGQPGKDEIIAGSSLSVQTGESLRIYGIECLVVGKLSSTGTGLDTAVYANEETIKHLIEASKEVGLSMVGEKSPDETVSAVYIKVKKGYDISVVSSTININFKDRVEAVRTKSMISDTVKRLDDVSKIIYALVTGIWVFSIIIMGLVFSVSIGERKSEFALLRAMGFSKIKIVSLIFTESMIICLIGSVLGIVLSLVIIISFGNMIEGYLGLPFLLPNFLNTVLYSFFALFITVLTGPITASISAMGVCREDIGNALRR